MAKSDNGELNTSIFGSNTSDPNNSLLKKVTKRVSGLFPSSLTKWFGPSDGQSVVRRRESVDEDDEDTLHVQQPPKKRAKPSSDVDFANSNNFTITSTPLLNSRNELRHLQPGPSGYTRHSTISATTTSLNYDSSSVRNEVTLANGDNKSDSGDSTSGYSSVQPQPHKESTFISDKGKTVHQPNTSKTSPNKSLNVSMNSSRSLFSEQSLNPQRQCLSARRPSFSASTFGSPSFVDRTLSTKRAVNSPFYGGRTMYGGASAYRRNKVIFPRDETHNVTIRNSIDIKPVKNTSSNNDSVNLSKTARRILDTLEHFSTPVLDAKKIPNINRQSCDINKSSIQRRTSYSVPNKELLVPTVPDLIKMKLKERLQDSTEKVRKVATTSKSVLNTEYSIRTIEETNKPQKHISKMKTKVTSVRDRNENMTDTVDIVKLPEVKLPITNLPKFNFTLPPPPTVTVKSSTTEIIKNVSSASVIKPVTTLKTDSTKLNFANPIIVSEKPKSVSVINNFTFSEPLNAKSCNKSINSTTVTFNFNSTSNNTAPRRKEVSKNNGQNSVGVLLQPTTQFVSGSVMDILGKPEKKTETDNLMNKFKPAPDTWECNTCMIRNIPSANRCIACETLRDNSKEIESQKIGFGNKFKMPSDKWECSVCMVRNNSTDTKCVACTTTKPATVSGTLPVISTTNTTNSFSGFGDKFKPASDTWECSVCMVRNKNDTVKCVACETPKPGAKNESKSTLIMPPEIKTNSSGFGELIKKQQTNWECSSCMVRNPPEKNICACCEAPKPGEKHEFKFGAQPISENKFKFGIDNATNSGFKFGTDNTSTATTFSFGIKPNDKATDTKPSTKTEFTPITSGFSFGIPATNKIGETKESSLKPTSAISTVNNTFTFSTPISSETGKSASSISGAFSSTTPTTIKSSGYNFGVPTTTVQSTESKPSFSFSATSNTNITTIAPVVSSSTVKPVSTTIIFGNVSSAQPTSVTTTTAAAIITSPNKTTNSTSTFSFGTSTNTKSVPFNSENKLQGTQFNFGTSSLAFNTVQPASITTVVTTCATTLSIGNNTTTFSNSNTNTPNKTEISAFGNIQPTFTFSGGNNVSNNKSEVKPFAFSGSGEPATKIPAFTFSQNDTPATAAPLAKAPVFNFGASSTSGANAATGTTAPAPAASLFSFGGNKTEKPVTFGTGSSSVFRDTAQPSTIPQNGGFNFGTSNAPMSFNFGAGNNPIPASTPAVFGFGSSQAGSGSVTVASTSAVPSSGIFTFGNPTAAQQQTPAFSPNIKPNFNFTGGSLPSFTAQTAPLTGALPQRKIRKAVRRTQPR